MRPKFTSGVSLLTQNLPAGSGSTSVQSKTAFLFGQLRCLVLTEERCCRQSDQPVQAESSLLVPESQNA